MVRVLNLSIANSRFRPCDTRYGSFYVTGKGWNEIFCIYVINIDVYKHYKQREFWPRDTRYVSFYVTGKEWNRIIETCLIKAA